MSTLQPLPWLLLLALGTTLSGCVSKSTANAEARAAFATGQQQGMMRMAQQDQSQASTVTVVGQVRNSVIPWTPDLTLAQAIVAADYFGKGNPTSIIIVHNGVGRMVDPKKLLSGEDVPLAEHDVVTIRP